MWEIVLAERNKIAIVGTPCPSLRVRPRDVLLDNLSRNLPEGFEVLVVAGGGSPRKKRREGGEPEGPSAPEEGFPSGTPAEPTAGKIRVVRLDARLDLYLLGVLSRLQSFLPGSARHFYRSYRELFYARRAAALCAREGARCIAFSSCPQWAPVFRRANPKAGLVFFNRTDWLREAPPAFGKYLDFMSAVVCPYESLAGRIAERYPGLRERIHVVLDGVDTDLFRPQELRSRHRLLYVGRLSPERGIHLLVEAFRRLKERYPDADLILAGSPERSPKETLLGTSFGRGRFFGAGGLCGSGCRLDPGSSASEGIFLAGRVPYDKLPALYGSSTILVFPALVDTAAGLVIAEAMASGLPVVASRKGPAPEMILDGRTGLLVEAGSTDALVAAVERIFDNRENAAKMAETARARAVELYDWKRVTRRCLVEIGLGEALTTPLPAGAGPGPS